MNTNNMKKTIFLVALIALATSCTKEDNQPLASPQDIARAEAWKASILDNSYRLTSYTATQPIDYNDTDQVVKSETDLWQYVSGWLKDDSNRYAGSDQSLIYQLNLRVQGDNSEVITRPYRIGADKDGPYMDWVNYLYQPLRYRLVDFDNQKYSVRVDFKGQASLISVFEKLE